MPETKEVTASQVPYELTEELEKERFHEISTPSRSANRIGNQAPNFDKKLTVGETQAKKARLLRELEDLAEEEDGVRKEEEELRKAKEELRKEEQKVSELECELKAARKRVQEQQAEVAQRRARVASLSQEKQLAYSPPTENTSTSTRFDNPPASISQTAAVHSLGSNDHAILGNSVDSASSPKPHASSSYHPIRGTVSTSSTKALTYYTELDAQSSGKARLFHDMDLDQLRDLVAQEEDADSNSQQTNSAGHIYYFIFMKTGAIEDLERAIQRAEGRIPGKIDNPDYAPRLKDLIVMLVKKYEHTNSLDNLQEAIFRAQEMIATTPPDQPDRPARIGDWINMMLKKCSRTGSQDDLDEAMIAAQEAGAVISTNNPDRGGPFLQVGIPMFSEALTPDLNYPIKCAETPAAMSDHYMADMELFNIEAEMASVLHDMSDEDLHSFAELHEDPANDGQIELYIYTCFLLFTRTRSIEYFIKAMQQANAWVAATVADHPDRARRFQILMSQQRLFMEDVVPMGLETTDIQIIRLSNQAARLEESYQQTGVAKDFDEAIGLMERVVSMAREEQLNQALMCLGGMLGRRFERTGSMNDLNRIVEIIGMAVETTPQDHPYRAGYMNNLGKWLVRRFERTGTTDDLNHAIKVTNDAVATCAGRSGRAACLNNLAVWLCKRFERTGVIEDLNRAVEVAEEAVATTPPDHPDRAGHLNNLGVWFLKRFERTDVIEDLDHAIKVAAEAVAIMPLDRLERASFLINLGIRLFTRSERTGAMEDLNHAIEVADETMATTSPDHPDRAAHLNSLGVWLWERFKRTGAIEDLDRAIKTNNDAAAITPSHHLNRASYLNNIGLWLCKRYWLTGEVEDLNRAVEVAEEAVATTPPDHPDRAGYLSNLGSGLCTQFERTGAIEDLNRAVKVAEEAVATTPPNHPDQAGHLYNLGIRLGTRFERTGAIEDLNRAVEVATKAVNIMPLDRPERAGFLNNLGIRLCRRFERTGAMEDLDHAVEVADEAVATTSLGHYERAIRLHAFGCLLMMRYGRNGAANDLDRAIKVIDEVVANTPPCHSEQNARLNSLGLCLGRRFELTGMTEDLDRAIEIIEKVTNTSSPDHPDRAAYLNNLGSWLRTRFKRTGLIEDLNSAVKVAEEAVATTPPDHPDRIDFLDNLGTGLFTRFEWTGAVDDIKRSVLFFTQGWNCSNAQPSKRIKLAEKVATILASQSNWEESSSLLQDAVKLLPTVSPRSLQHTDKQHMLASFTGLASMAAAATLNAGGEVYHALQLLELGRGIIAGLLMEMRGDISNLKHQHPGLADEFISLRDELDSPADRRTFPSSIDNTSSWESQAKRRREADGKFNELIIRIRAQPRFHNFLLPPSADELMAAADPDPIIVVNLSSCRCDAFLIERSWIRVLELPGLTLKEVQERARDLRRSRLTGSSCITLLLEWLWDVVARPCLEALGFTNPISGNTWPRVWWIPTGLLTQVPLHAAGRHAQGSKETVLDRVMSSYSSSVKALIYGRQHHARKPAGPPSDHALLVAMRETPGLFANRILPFAADEVKMLSDLCSLLQLKPIKPTLRKDDVLKHLQDCWIFHFAGHGRSDPLEPSQSCLLLEDWEINPLTVGDLRDHRFQENPPFLGYLSACSTGTNEADELVDEGIHLVSALQLAGFRHVVGTLWEVSDEHCVDVARVVYETMRDEGMTDMAVCRGLHRAVRALRDGQIERRRAIGDSNTTESAVEDNNREERNATLVSCETQSGKLLNTYWVPYVHFGV